MNNNSRTDSTQVNLWMGCLPRGELVAEHGASSKHYLPFSVGASWEDAGASESKTFGEFFDRHIQSQGHFNEWQSVAPGSPAPLFWEGLTS